MAVACSSGKSPRSDVVLITVDTLRADRLEPYGDTTIATPNIAALARRGVLFEHAYTNTTWTLPSLTTVMTGEYPYEHHVRTWIDQLAPSVTTLAEIVRQRGYHTTAIVASAALDRGFGLAQGFDDYDDSLLPQGGPRRAGAPAAAGGESADHKPRYLPDDQVTDKAIAWWDRRAADPFFLWVHFFGPHEKPARDRELKAAIAAYDPDVEFMDRQVGRLLDHIAADRRRAAHTVIILHSDHGQQLGEHGLVGHGFWVSEAEAHVPLIIQLPEGQRAGERVAALVRNIDIFPTVLRLAGVTPPAGTHGHDLLAPIPPNLAAYMETFLYALDFFSQPAVVNGKPIRVATAVRGLRTLRWKLVVNEPVLPLDVAAAPNGQLPAAYVAQHRSIGLVDLQNDAHKGQNAATANPERTNEMLAMLAHYTATDGAPPHRERQLDAGTRERLRALGYLSR